jgi:transcription antitermination factor NusG
MAPGVQKQRLSRRPASPSRAAARFFSNMNWYALATAGRRERSASAALQAVGIETLAPLYREQRETRLVTSQLFPGYVLALTDLLYLQETLALWRLSHYLSAVGLHKLVGICGQPSAIEPKFVDGIIDRIDANGFFIPALRKKASQYAEIDPGAQVVIQDGPYAGLFAQFSHMRGPERSIVLTKMFGRDCPVEVARADIVVPATEQL